MGNSIKSTEELLEELRQVAVTNIIMTERGVEFLNDYMQTVFIIPFAKGGN